MYDLMLNITGPVSVQASILDFGNKKEFPVNNKNQIKMSNLSFWILRLARLCLAVSKSKPETFQSVAQSVYRPGSLAWPSMSGQLPDTACEGWLVGPTLASQGRGHFVQKLAVFLVETHIVHALPI